MSTIALTTEVKEFIKTNPIALLVVFQRPECPALIDLQRDTADVVVMLRNGGAPAPAELLLGIEKFEGATVHEWAEELIAVAKEWFNNHPEVENTADGDGVSIRELAAKYN